MNSIFTSINQTLQQPYPFFDSIKKAVWMTLIVFGSVFSILYFLQPFDIDTLSDPEALVMASQFALVSLVVSAFWIIAVPVLFQKYFAENHWTVWKEILYMTALVALISIGNSILFMYISDSGFLWPIVKYMIGYTTLIGLIPITMSVIIKQHILLKKYASEASFLDQYLTTEPTNDGIHAQNIIQLENNTTQSKLILTGDNNEEILEVHPNDIFYMSASDNYVQIYFQKSEQIQSVLFRTTLKKAALSLTNYPQYYRCHKSYLVNLKKIIHITGNTQGYKLHLTNITEMIPVSRSLNDEIKEKIKLFTPRMASH
ncbi:MAG: LytTR family DNA-binding domain-containing protein [Saprospiraceae bacterium]